MNLVVIIALFTAAKSKRFQVFITDFVFKLLSKLKIIKDYEYRKLAFEEKVTQFRREIRILLNNKKVLISTLLLATIRITIVLRIPYFCMRVLDPNVTMSIIDCICVTAFI